jgi:hypothetical protein
MLLPAPPDRTPDLDDDFPGPGLDSRVWLDHYLPHWTTPERSRARYDIDGTGLRLRIDLDQPDWRPEDAPLRVSNVQTGNSSGPVGSAAGTHRHRSDGLQVRTATALHLGWAPTAGRVDLTVSASVDAGCMTAAWLVGTSHLRAEQEGEICLFEIDADAITPTWSRARSGVKAHGDGRLLTDMADVTVPLDASLPHTWTAIWGSGAVVIGCEGRIVRVVEQSPDYPLVLMLDLFETGGPTTDGYPKSARFHRVRGWSDAS